MFLRISIVLGIFCFLAVGGTIVNDVTRVNPIEVDRVVTPKSIQELIELVKNYPGHISIGGGRFSQGGQTALEGSLNIDMKSLDRVVDFKPDKKEITVEAGITWKKIQRHIDPSNLSIQIMQTYSNFTVGGSLSVNVHGRYIGKGPVIESVKSFEIVLADGKLVEASPTTNSDIFYGAIGGYGGLGVIVTVTLFLDDNFTVERTQKKMSITDYKQFFIENIRDNKDAVFHNADIYPPAFERVQAVTWVKTQKPVTEEARLIEQSANSFKNKLIISIISDWPFGKVFREYILDPWIYRSPAVYRRNYEASYDVNELEPFSRDKRTYVLQEYFIPVDQFYDFVPKMRGIFHKHHANIFNVSIRHANQDPGTLLAWAPKETFAFVVYYEQGFDEASRRHTGVWTREITDAILTSNGSYYLPYQIHATEQQFFQAYPHAVQFFELKHKLDPTYKFKNKLWERYLSEDDLKSGKIDPAPYVKTLKNYKLRPEEQTYLTVPEWYIVFSSDEYAQLLKAQSPTQFPWFSSIAQFWKVYSHVIRETKGVYPVNWGYHVMISVIGTSFSAEYLIKGLYENTIGRVTSWLSTDKTGIFVSSTDHFMQKLQEEYVTFIRLKPWYEFPFMKYYKSLWAEQPLPNESRLRRWERRIFYSGELLAKAGYGWVIGKATQATYSPEDFEIQVLVKGDPEKFKKIDPRLKVDKTAREGYFVGSLPRYEPFTDILPKFSGEDFTFYEIAGNQRIVATFLAPQDTTALKPFYDGLYRWPILTQTGMERQLVSLEPKQLLKLLDSIKGKPIVLDHAFDY
jgi:FAD/FMN-containing dehydrogenase